MILHSFITNSTVMVLSETSLYKASNIYMHVLGWSQVLICIVMLATIGMTDTKDCLKLFETIFPQLWPAVRYTLD